MRIVITGGTGLIGSELARSLAADGHQVIILTRSPEKYTGRFGANVQFARWDGLSLGDWVKHIDGADAIVNLAGESISGEGFLPGRWTTAKKQRILDSRKTAGEALVQAIAAVESKPGVLVQSSAIGYYGSTGDALITESSPAGDDFLAQVCVRWEDATQPVEDLGVRRVAARIGLVLSTDGGALPRMLLPSRLFVGGKFGSGDQYWSWIHLTDTVRALRFLIANEAFSGPVNVVAPGSVDSKAFAKSLGRALNRPSIVPVPAFALRLLLGEVADTVLEGQRVLPQRLTEEGFTFTYPDLAAAFQDLLS